MLPNWQFREYHAKEKRSWSKKGDWVPDYLVNKLLVRKCFYKALTFHPG